MPKKHWAIVGGGMMGLALARLLAKAGQQVTILEARPTLGGLADAWQLGPVVWDRHYHVTLLSDTRLRHLIEELGLADEMRWVETRTGFFTGGKFYSMSNTAEFLQFPPLKFLEKLRLGFTIWWASKISNPDPLEGVTVSSWLQKWSGRGTFDKIWLPLLRAKLGEAYKRTSAAFIWAHINRMYKARRTGLKKELFGYVRGGYARLLDAIQADLELQGVEVEVNAQIQKITSDPDLRNGVAQPAIHFRDGSVREFDHVIISAAAPVVSQLCPDLSAAERQRFSDVEYLGIVCASVLLTRPLAGYYVTNITDNVPFTAVIEMSAIVPPAELDGHTLVYLPKYVTQDDPTNTMSDDEVQATFFQALQRMYPDLSADQVAAFRVSRVRNVMAIPTLNYSQKLPPLQTSLPSVWALNSAHILKGNLNVNETITLAEELFASQLIPVIEQSNMLHRETTPA